MNQRDLLLKTLRRRSLTVLDAIHIGIYALSQRVGELKRAGHPITCRMVTLKNGKRVARYSLVRVK